LGGGGWSCFDHMPIEESGLGHDQREYQG
jgi:hypothetical protein